MTASTVLTCSDEALTSLATSPQLLACAVELAATPVSAEQGRELVRRLALLLRERPQLRPLVHELCVRLAPFSALGAGLREDQLLPLLHAAEQLLLSGGEPLRATIHEGSLLPLLTHAAPSVRSRATTLLCELLRTPDAARAILQRGVLVGGGQPAAAPLLRLLPPPTAAAAAAAASCPLLVPSTSVPHGLARVGSELVYASGAADPSGAEAGAEALVSTAHAEASLRTMVVALGAGQPVLLSGPAGCGKTSLLCELARQLGREKSMVKVHLDEQLDSKVLLGAYVCSEAAGEFEWQPGVVTQAVAQGRWLLLEDVDRAPLEVMSALSSLLEQGVLYVPGRA